MDYSKLSDNKINAEVALHWLGKGNFGLMNGAVETFGGSFNPCNNPADAWPIIVANRITLIPASRGDEWMAQAFDRAIADVSTNPLRSAMTLYLMMQEGE